VYPPLNQGQIWEVRANPSLLLYACQISFCSVHAVIDGRQKPQICLILYLGAPVPIPLNQSWQNMAHWSRPHSTLTCQISSRSVYSVAKIPKFYHIFNFGILAQQREDRADVGAQLQTFPYPTTPKPLVSYKDYWAKLLYQTLSCC